MLVKRDHVIAGIAVLIVLASISIIYIFASQSAGDHFQFGGFLLNPLDGNSYLAKMYEGWRRDIKFTLPYTAERGRGSYLFLYYLFLGHIARVLGFSLTFSFHLARIISALIMYICLYRFLSYTIDLIPVRLFAFILAVIGSGLGWLALILGRVTADFWVAEAYPYLAAYSNPHFPLGIGIVLILFTFTTVENGGLPSWFTVLLAFLLAIVLPFGVVLVLVVLTGLLVWELFPYYRKAYKSPVFKRVAWILLGGMPVLAYDVFVIYRNPLLRIWNNQNVTTSPSVWDLIVSLSPVIILAVIGVWINIRRQDRPTRLLITWVVLGMLLLYVPWGLQRRFILGYYIPLCALAAAGLGAIAKRQMSYIFAAILIILLSVPTNLVIALSTYRAINMHDPGIYITRGEADGFKWIDSHTPQDAIILAAPDTGLFIPAHTGRRVLYGHPYETADADVQKDIVTQYFKGVSDVRGNDGLPVEADYLFYGPREASLGSIRLSPKLKLVFTKEDVQIFQIIDR